MGVATFIVILIIAAFLHLSGYKTIALWVVIIGFILWLISLMSRKPSRAGAGHAAHGNVGEPIIIESTRSLPYRIPETMEIWMAEKKFPYRSYGRVKNLFGNTGKAFGKLLRGKEKEEK